jgi:hypothetical protein
MQNLLSEEKLREFESMIKNDNIIINILSSKIKDKTNIQNILKNDPNTLLAQFERGNIKVDKLDEETIIRVFYSTCNMLKEIDVSTNKIALNIMDYLIE